MAVYRLFHNEAKESEVRFIAPKRRDLTHFLVIIFFGVGLGMILLSMQVHISHNHTTTRVTTTGGKLNDALWKQGLSHLGFHQIAAKLRLAKLVRKYNRVCVVGVEYGEEVLKMADAGYEVHAFEPLSKFYDNLLRTISKHTRLNVQLYKMAAGESAGEFNLSYGNEAVETVHLGRIDEHVLGGLDVLSVDIQGNELDAVLGARRLLEQSRVRSLWVEIGACNPKTRPLLHLLDQLGYIVFDFVPWGQPKLAGNSTSLHEMPHSADLGLDTRPTGFDEYYNWMCLVKERHFEWLQNDILAIRREIVTPQIMLRLSSLSNDMFVISTRRRQEFS